MSLTQQLARATMGGGFQGKGPYRLSLCPPVGRAIQTYWGTPVRHATHRGSSRQAPTLVIGQVKMRARARSLSRVAHGTPTEARGGREGGWSQDGALGVCSASLLARAFGSVSAFQVVRDDAAQAGDSSTAGAVSAAASVFHSVGPAAKVKQVRPRTLFRKDGRAALVEGADRHLACSKTRPTRLPAPACVAAMEGGGCSRQLTQSGKQSQVPRSGA